MPEATGRGMLPLHIPQRRRLLAVGDVVVLNLGLLAGLALFRELPFSARTVAVHPAWFISYSLLWLTMALAGDNYSTWRSVRPAISLLGVVKALVVVETLYLILPLLTPPLAQSRVLLAGEIAMRWAPLLLWRLLFAQVLMHATFRRRAIIVGAGKAGQTVAEALREQEPSHLVVGFVDDDPAKWGQSVEGHPVIGGTDHLDELIERTGATDLIVAVTHGMSADLVQRLLRGFERGVRVVPMPALYEQITGRIPVEHIGERWLATLPLDRDPRTFFLMAKRFSDVVVSLIGLVFLAPFLPFIALAIKLESPGPVFYRPERLGLGGRPFRLWKLRTMRADADKVGDPTFTAKSDSRITRVGKLLRASHVDELPQFLNILFGEMSLVGPRPERYVPELEAQIPFYRMRLAVKPGTAGWALVKQGYAEGTEGTLVKLQYDLYYIKYQSVYLDVVIVIRTAVDMLFRRGQ